MNDRNTDTKSIIAQQFDLAEDTFLDEETMIQALAHKIAHMLEYEIDLLFSTLYRLDILEHKINGVLNNPDVPNDIGLAQLVIQRQKEKIATRKKYGSSENQIEGWEF